MSKEQQLKIMRAQLSVFTNLMEKMQYMHEMFDKDPEFTKEARNQIRGEISQSLK